ncbi:MAG TPA: DUF2207 domain-containing protein [Pseudolabrys sp.]|nr:DUF2207 domain-containing protein [Pseudolabrys sp.]
MSGLFRIAALLAVLAGASLVHAAEVIHSFDSNVEVAKDGELTVTESLRVHAEGNSMRHGIYRDLPLTFKDAGGTLREVTFHLLSVARDGKPEPYHTERTHGFIRIYAGDKDVLIPPGEHTYVFQYRTGRQVRWFDGRPELNWNVTGNFWNFPIEAATYRLQLGGGAAPVRWTAFAGRLGARGTDWRGSASVLGALTVSTTRRLMPGEGLTVVAELPASAVEPPSANTLLWYELFDNRQWIFGGIGLAVVLVYYLAAWSAVGRDPKSGTVIPLFHPPPGISPALANYIRDWGFGREKWRAFTAAALSLAVRGLIRFEQTGDTLTLKATGKQPQGGYQSLPAGEGTVFTFVSEYAGSVPLNKTYGQAIANAGDKFTKSIEAENKNRFFRRNLGYVIAGVAMTAAVIVGIVNFGGLQDQDVSILAILGFAGLFLGMFIVPIVQSVFGDGFRFESLVRVAISLAIAAIFVSIMFNLAHALLSVGLSEGLPALAAFVENYPFPFVLLTAFTALNGLFLYLMRAPTALGRPIMDQLAGFRLYLETAEADRLNLQAPEITADRFEALLPYAVALDVEKPWAQAFEAALRRAHPEDADPMRHYQPNWGSPGGSNWSGGNFSSAVAASVGGVSGALASAVPVSSGSSGFGGGGGGSGGGGGGGGGGGW